MTIHREQGALVAPVACASRYGRLNVTHMREMFDEASSFNQPLHAPWYVVERYTLVLS